MQYIISYYCINHIGHVRRTNQDNFVCEYRFMEDSNESFASPLFGIKSTKDPFVLGVFDGMGGEEHGEIASLIAAKNAGKLQLHKNVAADLSAFCQKSNEDICNYASENGIQAMGTTAAMLAFNRKGVTLCNIGDSKVFRYSNETLEQISYDHVETAAFGVKPPLSQNLGIPPTEFIIEPYLAHGKYEDGDRYVICSDGLTDMVSPEKIAQILNGVPIGEAILRLLKNALENGGKDNVTIILCEIRKKPQNIFKTLLGKGCG